MTADTVPIGGERDVGADALLAATIIFPSLLEIPNCAARHGTLVATSSLAVAWTAAQSRRVPSADPMVSGAQFPQEEFNMKHLMYGTVSALALLLTMQGGAKADATLAEEFPINEHPC